VWDEAKRLRCEWYNDYEKGVTKPPIRVSDLEVVELNFRGVILNWVPGLKLKMTFILMPNFPAIWLFKTSEIIYTKCLKGSWTWKPWSSTSELKYLTGCPDFNSK
jgi:hypothetical protein